MICEVYSPGINASMYIRPPLPPPPAHYNHLLTHTPTPALIKRAAQRSDRGVAAGGGGSGRPQVVTARRSA